MPSHACDSARCYLSTSLRAASPGLANAYLLPSSHFPATVSASPTRFCGCWVQDMYGHSYSVCDHWKAASPEGVTEWSEKKQTRFLIHVPSVLALSIILTQGKSAPHPAPSRRSDIPHRTQTTEGRAQTKEAAAGYGRETACACLTLVWEATYPACQIMLGRNIDGREVPCHEPGLACGCLPVDHPQPAQVAS